MQLEFDKLKIRDLLDLRGSDMLTVNPEYQRGAVWGESQQKKLVDSIFRRYPLPLIYLHHKKVSKSGYNRDSLEIIDGQQRINAIYNFYQGRLKLFDPVKDEARARFPEFIKLQPCEWAGCNYDKIDLELKERFLETELLIVKVLADDDNEARDLFIRLQSGLPLNPQEKRDAWPGGFTEFVLRVGGKNEIARYPGHDFFKYSVQNKSKDRGELRVLCAQLGMLFFEGAVQGRWMDINTQAIDDYYYQNLAFNVNDEKVNRFTKILDVVGELLSAHNGAKLKVHEAIHVVLLVDSLIDDYSSSWRNKLLDAFDTFRHNSSLAKKEKEGEYWNKYVSLTIAQASTASTLQRRHAFFSEKMFEMLAPSKKDSVRLYGELEREIIFYRDRKTCAVCGYEVNWQDLEIHHLTEHQYGGATTIENGVAVHKQCHPKGAAATEFYQEWRSKRSGGVAISDPVVTNESQLKNNAFTSGVVYKIENVKKGIFAKAIILESGKLCILKGSTIAAQVSSSFEETSKAAAQRRTNLINDGSIDSNYHFTKDVIFNSRSNAAGVVLGFSANGNVAWVPTSE